MKKNLVLMSTLLLGGLALAGCAQEKSSSSQKEESSQKENASSSVEEQKSSSESSTPIKHYLIGFYVDDQLYKTVQAEENKVIDVAIPDPVKEGYTFEGWKYENGDAFDIETTLITKSFNVYASFKAKGGETDAHEGESELNVTDTKDASKAYSLVIGWYGKSTTSGIDAKLMKHIYKNFINYLRSIETEENVIENMTVRQYGDEETKVAALGELVNADADVDILLGVGKNITSTGKVTTEKRTDNVTIGEVEGRSIALLKNTTLGSSLYDFIATTDGQKVFNYDYHITAEVKSSFVVNFYVGETLYSSVNVKKGEKINISSISEPSGENEFLYWADSDGNEFDFETAIISDLNLYAKFKETTDPHEGESELNVTDTKDASKAYSLVIGWYGKSTTSGIDETLMKHVYKNVLNYLEGSDITSETLSQISVRKYGDEETNVAALGKLVNADADVDILLGVGNNITSKGNVTTVDTTGDITMGEASGRYVALLKEATLARTVYDFMTSTDGKQIFTLNYHYSK